ncbi:MAG: ABC transporter ATP-binding protein, partial [Erysipelotrichaceae bacterium]|nr:ABC transporter ATP-binding protein [Erysipelotrichaceae bacterium]
MSRIELKDVSMVYPFQEVNGLFGRKKKEEILKKQKAMPYTSNEGVVALQHFSAVFHDGEFIAILGPSGSGKSTLLRIIAGLEEPPLGEVLYNDQNLHEIDIDERDIGMVFQTYSLYPNQSVYKNIAFPLEVKHLPREEVQKKVEEMAALVDLSDKLEKLPDELSGGEKQRVAIARALVKDPSVLLLDEPFSNLDVLVRAKLRKLLSRIHEVLHPTIIYVTHDQYDALALAERIVVLKDGITQMDDSVYNVYKTPKNRFVASFVGSPAMNFFDEIAVNKDGHFQILDQELSLTAQQKKQLNKGKLPAGIRPIDLHLERDGVKAVIEYTELANTDLLIHLELDGRKLTALEKAKEDQFRYFKGEEIKVSFEKEDLHLFNE